MRLLRICVLGFLSLILAGCATFQPVADRKDVVSAAESRAPLGIAVGDVLRLTRVDGTLIKLKVAAVDAGAITGLPTGRRQPVTIAIADIDRVERLEASAGGNRTVFWIVVAVAAAIVVSVAAAEDFSDDVAEGLTGQ
jgi:hypothetical protein